MLHERWGPRCSACCCSLTAALSLPPPPPVPPQASARSARRRNPDAYRPTRGCPRLQEREADMAGRSTGKQCHLLCSQRCAATPVPGHAAAAQPGAPAAMPALCTWPSVPRPTICPLSHCGCSTPTTTDDEPTVLEVVPPMEASASRTPAAAAPPPLQPGSRAAPSSGSSQVVAQLVHRAAKSRLQHPAELPRSLAMPTKTYAWCGPASQTCASLKRQTGTGREGASTCRRQPCSGGALV